MREAVGFIMGMVVFLWGHQADGETPAPRMLETHAVDVYNDTTTPQTLRVRVAHTRRVIATLVVYPEGSEALRVPPNTWPCTTIFEASVNGRDFKRLRGQLCGRGETGERKTLAILDNNTFELVHVSSE